MAAVSPSAQLQTALDSIETTVAVGDAYLKVGDLPHALNSYRTAGAQFGGFAPTGNSAALVAAVAAVTASTAAGIAQARNLLGQLFALYGSPGAAGLPVSSSLGTGAIVAIMSATGVGLYLLLDRLLRKPKRTRRR